jgi:7-keto-8-aminopelargonate synthetase-like enzyme
MEHEILSALGDGPCEAVPTNYGTTAGGMILKCKEPSIRERIGEQIERLEDEIATLKTAAAAIDATPGFEAIAAGLKALGRNRY